MSAGNPGYRFRRPPAATNDENPIRHPFVLHVPVTGAQIADSTHTVTHWGVVGARIDTEDGPSGYGFTGTHAHLPSDQLIARCIA